MSHLIYILSIACSLLAFGVNAEGVEDSAAKFASASEAYKNGDYENALNLFLEVDSFADGFAINYNIGNAYYKLKKIPSAILYFERALKYDPINEDARHNLLIANELIADRIETIPQSKLKLWWQEFKYSIGPDGWAWISIALALIAVGFGVFFWLSGGKNAKRFGFFGGIATLGLMLITIVLAQQALAYRTHPSDAIIFSDKVDVRSEPRNESTQVFVLHAGTKVKLLSKDGDWYNVEIASGNKGWISMLDLAEI